MSSKVVALVAYEPWADEFLLCGGDGKLKWLVSTDTDSPVPLSRLGGDKGDLGKSPRPPPTLDTLLGFLRLLARAGDAVGLLGADNLCPSESLLGVALADSGLGG